MDFKRIYSELLQSHWSFLILALFFGGLIIALTPPLWGADEAAHFFRAYQISEGELNQKKVMQKKMQCTEGIYRHLLKKWTC